MQIAITEFSRLRKEIYELEQSKRIPYEMRDHIKQDSVGDLKIYKRFLEGVCGCESDKLQQSKFYLGKRTGNILCICGNDLISYSTNYTEKEVIEGAVPFLLQILAEPMIEASDERFVAMSGHERSAQIGRKKIEISVHTYADRTDRENKGDSIGVTVSTKKQSVPDYSRIGNFVILEHGALEEIRSDFGIKKQKLVATTMDQFM